MRFNSVAAAAALAFFVPSVLGVTLSYDEAYDNGSADLSTVACSDGANGMLTKGFTTFSSLPHFPNIGGAAAIAGWNDTDCGSCWQLTYKGKSINAAMNTLTNGQAVQLGRIDVTAKQVAASSCGL
ncbi:immunomodulatory protein [Epithele typhae]|uniref:immunomodulatory protein n=1 Tax=Epithele typhae TaxID=378194 RepID=UPI002008E1DD|nr:immunomodulatory protein [Epithele typhae]KAH9918370.1 immunomodulatory protein [Epithele typhae]